MRSLARLAAYCRSMATRPEHPAIPPGERQLWAQMAGEIDAYLDGPTQHEVLPGL